jgi:hypothetical protein
VREAGASDAATELTARAASHASLDNPYAVVRLLEALREAGASDAATTLASRAARQVGLELPHAVANLMLELREVGASDAVTTLAARAADAAMFDLFLQTCPDEASRYQPGREPDRSPAEAWNWMGPDS